MPDNLPNPELYPPYASQQYVKVHDMNLYGVGTTPSLYVVRLYQTIANPSYDPNVPILPPTIVSDVYPVAGIHLNVSFTTGGKYQVHVGGSLAWVSSQTPPYTTRTPYGSGYPLAFSTLAGAETAMGQCDFDNSGTGTYSFYGRNPRFEMAQALDAYKQNSDEFDHVDSLITARLTARSVTNSAAIYNFISSKVINQDSNQQYALGLSAASGGGQNTTYIANSISASQYQAFAEFALKTAFETPIVTPFESPLVAEAHAQAVEAKNAGEIRDQQIRQAISSAEGVSAGITKSEASGTIWGGWDGASILIGAFGQQGAAKQT